MDCFIYVRLLGERVNVYSSLLCESVCVCARERVRAGDCVCIFLFLYGRERDAMFFKYFIDS
jgi:hypothetical protein